MSDWSGRRRSSPWGLSLALVCAACEEGDGAASPPGRFISPSTTADASADAGTEDTDAETEASVGDGDGGDASSEDGSLGTSDGALASDGGPPDLNPPPFRGAERILVSDALTNQITALDLAASSTPTRLELNSNAVAMAAGPHGRFAFVSAGDAVSVVDMGLSSSTPDGEMGEAMAPVLLDLAVEGMGAGALTAGGGKVGAFFDGEGRGVIIDEASLPEAISTLELEASAAHRGLAFAFGSRVLGSFAANAGADVELWTYDQAGARSGSAPLPCTHPGSAVVLESVAAVTCDEGLLLLEEGAAGLEARVIAAPTGRSGKPTQVLAHPAGSFFCDLGEAALCRVRTSMECVTLPAPVQALAVDPSGDGVLALDQAGALHLLDEDAFALGLTTTVTSAAGPSGSPHMTVVGNVAVLSDPSASALHVFDPITFQPLYDIVVEGAPQRLVPFVANASF